MSSNFAAPESLGAEAQGFSHIPDLYDLLPAQPARGGWPGVVYAIICVHNKRTAQELGLRPIRGLGMFTIHGEKGAVDVELLGRGTPIPGASPDAGMRELLLDGEISTLAGHKVPEDVVLWFRTPAASAAKETLDGKKPLQPTSPAAGLPESRESDARVQGGSPAQRKP